MNTEITNPVSVPASPAAISFTVKRDDTVTGTVAKIKQHPEKGILVVIPGNPMAFMPNGCIAGRNEAEKTARRAFLIANPGTEISVSVMTDPTVETVKKTVRGKEESVQVGRIKVSEQRVAVATEKAARAEKDAAREAAIADAVSKLVTGSIVKGAVRPATKDSDRKDGTKYTYGAFVTVGGGISGLLHVRQVEGGDRGLAAILAAGTAEVEIVDAKMENGQPRIQLSQKSVGDKVLATWATDNLGKVYKGKVVKTGEQAGNLHGRVIELLSGDKVFLCDEDTYVKSETALSKGNATRVKITDEIVGGMVRVTRKGV